MIRQPSKSIAFYEQLKELRTVLCPAVHMQRCLVRPAHHHSEWSIVEAIRRLHLQKKWATIIAFLDEVCSLVLTKLGAYAICSFKSLRTQPPSNQVIAEHVDPRPNANEFILHSASRHRASVRNAKLYVSLRSLADMPT